eukprot:TRINITY_DN4560_c0_g1_i1.p2 TRINITY_DN4560_c0_g1~~TRINITY_DN4560_c0_g1_i1.p2  ORF type:complete len:313 (+),score=16.23 TRINITY_DN4560_c0_g1_i1:93-1031(+)
MSKEDNKRGLKRSYNPFSSTHFKDQQTRVQGDSPSVVNSRVRILFDAQGRSRTLRSGFRGLTPAVEDDKKQQATDTPCSSTQAQQRRGGQVQDQARFLSAGQQDTLQKNARKRFLNLYDHLDCTNPRSCKRSRLEEEINRDNIPSSVEPRIHLTTSSKQADTGETVMDQFSKQLGDVLEDTKLHLQKLQQNISQMAYIHKEAIETFSQQVQQLQDQVSVLGIGEDQLTRIRASRDAYKSAFEQSVRCQICMDRNRDVLLMPCMHLLYCNTCIAQHKQQVGNFCPCCRCGLQGVLSVNMMTEQQSPPQSQSQG